MRAAATAVLAAMLATASVAGEDAEPAWVGQARDGAVALASELQQALRSAMNEGGPVAAVEVCKLQAPAIADNVSGERMAVGRTSLKVRNPNNGADDWEARMMADFEQRLADGEAPGQLEAFALRRDGDRRYGHWMKAIPTQGLCTACHGSDLDPEVAEAIDSAYPEDRARGFSVGDLRGAFSVVVELEHR